MYKQERQEVADTAANIQAKVKELLEQTVDQGFLERPEWGEVNFVGLAEWLVESRKTWEEISDTQIALIGKPNLDNLNSLVNSLVENVGSVRSFTITEGDAGGRRDQIANAMVNSQERLIQHIAPWIGFLMYRQGDIRGKMQEIERAGEEARLQHKQDLEVIKDEQAAHRKHMENENSEIQNIKESVRQSAEELGVGTFTESFSSQAEVSAKSSRAWLCTTGILAFITLVTTVGFGFDLAPFHVDGDSGWEANIARVAVVGLLAYITRWCGQMYKATKHQELTNIHRALSLKTVQAFGAAAQSPEAREAVLISAAKCIFEGRSTGLASEQGSAPTTTTQIIETARKTIQGSE